MNILIVSIIEESLKLSLAVFLSSKSKIDNRVSGLIIGLAFGLFETFLYWHLGITQGVFILWRLILAVPSHSFETGIASFRKRYILVSILIHITYNLLTTYRQIDNTLILFVLGESVLCLLLLFFRTKEIENETLAYIRKNKTLTVLGFCVIILFGLYVNREIIRYNMCVKALTIQQYCL